MVNQQTLPTFHVDFVTPAGSAGWVFAPAGHSPIVSVQVWHGERMLAERPVDAFREDVGAHFGPQFAKCGFRVPYGPLLHSCTLHVKARNAAGEVVLLVTREVIVPNAAAIPSSMARPFEHPTPFPLEIAKVLRGIDARFDRPLSDADQEAAVDVIAAHAHPAWSTIMPDVIRYVRFLRDTWVHMESVDRYFPEVNANAVPGAHDHHCKANSPSQMISIAHQLYVAKSHGLTGAFAEFGCFKGFSSSMLSQPCARLGIPMLIFDSFEGLPPSDDPFYKPGEFCGGLDEVKSNIATFGDISDIKFIKGFFSDSLANFQMPKLLQVWMDVDLYSSAKDLSSAFAAMDPRAAIFSHECEVHTFRDGRVAADIPRSGGFVAPAVVDKLRELGTATLGRFLTGNTGVFWREQGGMPVLSHAALMRLMNKLR